MTYTENDLRRALKLLENLAPALADPDAKEPVRRRDRRILIAAIAMSMLVIVAVAVTSLVLGASRHGSPAITTSRTQITDFDGLLLKHPLAWRHVSVTWSSTGPSGPLGYLTDAKVGNQCKANVCGAPVATLGRNQALVTVDEAAFGFPLPASANTTVAGFPALDRTYPNVSACPTGTSVERSIEIAIPFQGSNSIEREMMLTACFSGPDQAAEVETFQQMINDAHFKYPSTGPAAIHGTVTISGHPSAGTSSEPYVQGNLLVYDNPQHTGIGEFNSSLTQGSFNVGVGPGTYYLEIQRPNRSPCTLGPVVVTSNEDVQANVTCPTS